MPEGDAKLQHVVARLADRRAPKVPQLVQNSAIAR
jgi:hypothetical protein